MWQHRHIHLLAVVVSFGLPTLLGALWDGWIGALGGFLIGGVAKVVVIQHGTFLINSACHTIRPPAVFHAVQRARLVFHGVVYFRRRLP